VPQADSIFIEALAAASFAVPGFHFFIHRLSRSARTLERGPPSRSRSL